MSGPVVTLGETMGLLTADSVGHLAHVSTMTLGVGGAESNVAIGLARLGTSTAWIGRLGSDAVGDRIVRELRAEGVAVHAARDAAPTGLMLKERPPGGGVRVWYHRAHAAGSRLCPADVDDTLVASAALLHVTGITPALGPAPAAALDRAVDVARAAGVPVSVDVNHRASLWPGDDASPTLQKLVMRADVVFAGTDEARVVLATEEDDPEALAAGLAALGAPEVVIKLGAEGALALLDDRVHRRAAVPVEVVDTVGAGDAFVAAYLADRVAGEPVGSRLVTAVRAGALMCTVSGDWEALPTRAALAAAGTDPVRR